MNGMDLIFATQGPRGGEGCLLQVWVPTQGKLSLKEKILKQRELIYLSGNAFALPRTSIPNQNPTATLHLHHLPL